MAEITPISLSVLSKDKDGDNSSGGDEPAQDACEVQAEPPGESTTEQDKPDPTQFHGQKRSNATHLSSADADARLYCKGDNASRLRYMGHTLCDNRHGPPESEYLSPLFFADDQMRLR